MTSRLGIAAAAAPLGCAILVAALLGSQVPDRPTLAIAAIIGPLAMAVAFLRIEAAYALLIFARADRPRLRRLPTVVAGPHAVVAVGALRALALGRWLVVPWAFVAYLAVYVLAMLHGNWNAFDIVEAGKYMFFPLLALTTASIAVDPDVRARLVGLLIVAAVVQIPVAAYQSAKVVLTYGNPLAGVDTVTGLVQSRGAGTLAMVTVALATVCLALSLEGVWRPRLFGATAIALSFVGVMSGSRGVYTFVPAAFFSLLLGYVFFGERAHRSRRLVGFLGLSVVLLPALVLAMGVLYPGANTPFKGAQNLQTYLQDTSSSAGTLPNRGAQLRIAVEQSLRGSLGRTALGAGVGTTRFGADPHFATPKSDPLVIGIEQRTNGVWVPRLITETGYAGVAAFLGLLLYLLAVARRGYKRTTRNTLDRALMVALPGLIGLTFVGAFYNTALAVQPFATALWILVGLCLAVDRAPAHGTRKLHSRRSGAGLLAPSHSTW